MRRWKRITRTHMTPLAKNNLAAPDIRLGDRDSLKSYYTVRAIYLKASTRQTCD